MYSTQIKQNERREVEETTTLSEILLADDLNNLSVKRDSSAQEILMSGALPGEDALHKQRLAKTKADRIKAYMSLNTKTVSDTKGWRIRAAYRMVMYMGRIIGDVRGPATLSVLFDSEFGLDKSSNSFSLNEDAKSQIYGCEHIIEWAKSMEAFIYLPHEIEDNKELNKWCEAYSELSTFLRIDDGTLDEPESGIFGTVGMFDVSTSQFLWPSRDELMLYEELLLLRIFDELCQSSGQKTEQIVVKEFGYSRPEAVMLVKSALRYGTAVYSDDFDINKIKELKSLDVLADVAMEGDDPRAVLAARKQLQLVAGLTANNLEDGADDFRELAQKSLEWEEEDQNLLPNH